MNLKQPFAASIFAFVLFALPANGQEVLLRERCNQGECGFTRIVTKRISQKNDNGVLWQVKSRSVVVPTPKKAGDPETMPAPDSFGLVRVSYAYCSTTKPAIIFYDDKKFYAHVLNVGETPAGYAVNSLIEYWAVCHDKVVSVSDVMEGKLAKDAADLGYHKVAEAEQGQYIFRNKKKAFRFFGL